MKVFESMATKQSTQFSVTLKKLNNQTGLMLHYTLGSAQNLRPVLTILAIK